MVNVPRKSEQQGQPGPVGTALRWGIVGLLDQPDQPSEISEMSNETKRKKAELDMPAGRWPDACGLRTADADEECT